MVSGQPRRRTGISGQPRRRTEIRAQPLARPSGLACRRAAGELALELGAGEACPARKSETTARIAEEGSSDDSNGGQEGSWRPDRFRLGSEFSSEQG